MVLATNAKKFKYSTFNKILCVIICLASFAGSAKLISGMFFSVMYQDESIVEDSESLSSWTTTVDFTNLLSSDLNKIYTNTISDSEKARLKKAAAAVKDETVAAALEYRDSQIAKLSSEFGDGYEYAEDEYWDDNYLSDYHFEVNSNTLYIPVYVDDTQESLSAAYDEYVNTWITEQTDWGIYFHRNPSADLNYISYLNDKVKTSSLSQAQEEKFDKSKVKENDYYIIIEDSGLKDCGGISMEIAQTVCDMTVTNKYYKNVDIYMYFNNGDLGKSLLSYISFDNDEINSYSQLKDFDFFANDYKAGAIFIIPAAVILLAISFICGFYYFSISGKKSKEDFAKLRFTDYLPFELQLGAGFGVGFGIIAVFYINIYNYFTDNTFSLINVWAITVVAAVIQIALFCICAANARFAKSGKKFYKHLLTYWILFAGWKFLAFVFRAVKKGLKRLKASTKRTAKAFKYKPGNFKKNVIALTVIYALVNLILFLGIVLLIMIFIETIGLVIPFILAVGDLVGNILILRRVLEYIKYLDMIITASSQHTDITVPAEELPESLRILAEGMKYTNAELQQAVNKAVKDERLRTELITNVSHDLKTPLTSIITYADLLSKCDIGDERAKEYISVLSEKGEKLKRLIDDLIEASKVTSGVITINTQPMNLSELCLQATVDAQQDFEKAGLELIVKSGETPVIISADGAKTFRIIENLLSNAHKYSAKASRVYVSVYRENGFGVFEIKNMSARALDISPDELTERFVRGDKSRSEEGNGLGLSIAKELCRAQGGSLEIIIDGDLFKAIVRLPESSGDISQ